MEELKVSIIVPVHKAEAHIEDCVRSVIAQTYSDLELILVDDRGGDRSIEVAERTLKEGGFDNYTIVRHDSNRGAAAARNSGIDVSTGDYLFFLDSDDELSPDCISRLVEPLSVRKYDCVVCAFEEIGGEGSLPLLQLPGGPIESREEILEAYRDGKLFIMPFNKLCRRDFIVEKRLYFDTSLKFEDELWSLAHAVNTGSMFVLEDRLYKYKRHPGSMTTGSDYPDKFKACCRIAERMYQYLIDNDLKTDPVPNQIAARFFHRSYGYGMLAGYSRYFVYKTLRDTDVFSFREKMALCFSGPLAFARNFHRLFPVPLGLPAFFISKRFK